MSLRWRILGALLAVILLTVLFSIGITYWSAQRQLSQLSVDIRDQETAELAQHLSLFYTQMGDWTNLESTLMQAGYLYDEGFWAEIVAEEELADEEAEVGEEWFYYDPLRILIVDTEHNILLDSYGEYEPGEELYEYIDERGVITDLRTRQPVGYVYVNVDPEFFADETAEFLAGTLTTTLLGGLLTALIILLPAFWMARRLTAPIIALTKATRTVAQYGEAQLLPVNSQDELGQMSEAFNQMTRSLQAQRDLRKRLVDDVSHELGTPLSVIHLEAASMRDGMQTPEEAAAQIIIEVTSLRTLVEDLNRLADTDAGGFQLALEPCDVGQLLAAEVARWEPLAVKASITLVLESSPELPIIDLDPARFSQVMGNLLRNALQHTEAGGQVTVSTQHRPIPIEPGEWIVIAVADDGPGIDPADLPHIFERFYRADLSRTRQRDSAAGHGLGLAIARELVRLHDGYIWADNIPGQGATFFVALR